MERQPQADLICTYIQYTLSFLGCMMCGGRGRNETYGVPGCGVYQDGTQVYGVGMPSGYT